MIARMSSMGTFREVILWIMGLCDDVVKLRDSSRLYTRSPQRVAGARSSVLHVINMMASTSDFNDALARFNIAVPGVSQALDIRAKIVRSQPAARSGRQWAGGSQVSGAPPYASTRAPSPSDSVNTAQTHRAPPNYQAESGGPPQPDRLVPSYADVPPLDPALFGARATRPYGQRGAHNRSHLQNRGRGLPLTRGNMRSQNSRGGVAGGGQGMTPRELSYAANVAAYVPVAGPSSGAGIGWDTDTGSGIDSLTYNDGWDEDMTSHQAATQMGWE